MKRLLLWTLIFLLITGATTLALYDNGRLSLVWGDYVIETSGTFALALVGALVLATYGVLRLLGWLWRLPHTLRARRQLKRLLRAEAGMGKGLLAGEHGDWRSAERALIRAARLADNGVMYYLAAARMAHNQGAGQRRDRYLKEAREKYPQDFVTVALVEARLLADEAPQKALALLESLIEDGQATPAVWAEYAQLLARLDRWAQLREVLPQVKRARALPAEALQALEQRMWTQLLAQAQTPEALDALWNLLEKRWRQDADVLAAYVARRLAFGETPQLAGLLEKALKRRWDPRLVYLYGQLKEGPAFDRLKKAEKWLRQHPDDAVLLATLGRLACQAQLWGQGQAYLRQSLALRPDLETFRALAECYEAAGESEKAALIYKDAMAALEKRHDPLLLPAPDEGRRQQS